MLSIDLLADILRIVSIIVKFIVFIKILDLLFERKENNKILYISFILLIIMETFPPRVTLNYTGLINNLLIISWILFAKKNYKINYFQGISTYIIYDIVYYFISDAILSIVYFCVTKDLMIRSTISKQTFNLISLYSYAIKIFINLIFIYAVKKLLKLDTEKRNIIYIVCCILVNLLIAFMNYIPTRLRNIDIYSELNRFNYISAPKLSVLSSILLIIIMIQVIRDSKIKADNKIIKEKLDMQYNYYLSIQESQNKVKKLYHDINNHMACIKSLYNEKEDVDEYINSINKEMNDFQNEFNTENMILDIILNEKKVLCKKNNIDLFCDINFSKCKFIEMADVCAIFSNILDNAIEACNSIDSNIIYKNINIRGTVVKSYYVIKCENIKVNKVKIKNNKIFTTKKDKFIHGIGLESVKSSLKKYNGEFKVEDLENKFIIKIYIPLQNMTVGTVKIPTGESIL